MKILMSAFSCGPRQGSEPGVGWNMALEAARLGHEIVVLTQTEFRAEIEQEIASGVLPANLRFDIFMPAWLEIFRDFGLRRGFFSLTWHMVNFLWQFCALHHARRVYKDAGFDFIHHVTLAGIRYPTLLGWLGLPTVIGPLGGGERAPMALRSSMPWKFWFAELLRDTHTLALRADPFTRSAFRNAELIILRSEDSLVAVPPRFRNKALIDLGIGITEIAEGEATRREPGKPFKLLYAGRIVYWKGSHLAIRALASARSQGVDAMLTLVGSGPARPALGQLARELGVADYISWRGQISRQEVLDTYRTHQAFLFPSMRDAAPVVVLEAFAHGLPVICLALGGPGAMVDETCGCAIPVANRSETECVADLATQIADLAANEDKRLALGSGAILRYRKFIWPKVVRALYAEIGDRLRRVDASEKWTREIA